MASRIMDFQKMDDIINPIWYGSRTPAGIKRWEKRVNMIKLHLKPDIKILEIGSGIGDFTDILLRYYPDLELTVSDFNPEYTPILFKKYDKMKNIKVKLLDIENTFIFDRFDIIIGNGVLHHIKDLDLAFHNIYNLLNKDGKILFFDPNILNPYVYVVVKFNLFGNLPEETAFKKRDLKSAAEKHFGNVEIKNFDFIFPLTPIPLIGLNIRLSDILEKTYLINNLSGSLYLYGEK